MTLTRYYSDKEIGELLGMSHRTVEGWRHQGLLPYHKLQIGRGMPRARVAEEDLRKFLEERMERVPSAAEVLGQLGRAG